MTIRFKFHGRCEAHPRYNPQRQGWAGIKGGCKTCEKLWRIYSQIDHCEKLSIGFVQDAVRTKQMLEKGGNVASRNYVSSRTV